MVVVGVGLSHEVEKVVDVVRELDIVCSQQRVVVGGGARPASLIAEGHAELGRWTTSEARESLASASLVLGVMTSDVNDN